MSSGILTTNTFGQLPDGSEIHVYWLRHPDGLRVAITDFGGAITALHAPDRLGNYEDVVLGYDTLVEYLAGKSFFGGIIGRHANRIARGRFTLDGAEHELSINDGDNHLHGGATGFDRVPWRAELGPGARLTLTRTSPDGEQGYPGSLRVWVTYSVEDRQTLRIDFAAETDRATPVNLTQHPYFNLAGHNSGSILNHELTLFAEHITPIDEGLIPTGALRSVEDTPFDFRMPRRIGERIDADDAQLRFGRGYDHNFVLARRGSALTLAARLREPRSGRVLELSTTEPGLQFYSGNFLSGGDAAKGGGDYGQRAGLCLEPQHFPDSPNQPSFPNTILRPGERYHSTTLLRFSAE